jgi:hypothetical protein
MVYLRTHQYLKYRAVNKKLIAEWVIVKYTEVSGCDLIGIMIPALFWRHWHKYKNLMSVSRPIFEPGTSRIQGTSVIDWAQIDLIPSNNYISYFRCPFFTSKINFKRSRFGHTAFTDFRNFISRCRHVSLHGRKNGRNVMTMEFIPIKKWQNTSAKGGIRHLALDDKGGQ